MKLSAIALFPCISANAYEATSQANVYLLNPDEATSISLVNIDNLLDSSKLDGSYIHIVNTTNCATCNYSLSDRSATNNFIYPENTVEFSETMAYYHMNNYRNYVAKILGFNLVDPVLTVDVNKQNTTGAEYTPNSFGSTRKIVLGVKNKVDVNGDWIADFDVDVDMSKSPDVLVHEFAHSIIEDLSPFSFHSIPYFLQEGWADYLSASFNNNVYMGGWTDQLSYRGYRRSVIEGISENDLWPKNNIRSQDGIDNTSYANGRKYYAGMRWSAFLWRLRERVSSKVSFNDAKAAEITDSIILKGISLFNDSNGITDDPVQEMRDGINAIKSSLLYFKSLSPFSYQYDNTYSVITNDDIDYAWNYRYRRTLVGNAMNWNTVSLNKKQMAWTHQTGRNDVSVAILDTGILTTNQNKILGNEDLNFNGVLDGGEDLNNNSALDTGNSYVNQHEIPGDNIDNDNNGFIDDVSGWDFSDSNNDPSGTPVFGSPHGDGVANNLLSTIWNSSIQILRIRDDFNLKWAKYNNDQTRGFNYAIKNNIGFINISAGYFAEVSDSSQKVALSYPADSFSMAAFNEIQSGFKTDGGSIIVAAAGNSAMNIDSVPVYSASLPLPNIISVTGTDSNDLFSSGLNYGKYNVDLSAESNSTSMAAPQVTAALALLQSEQNERQEAHPGYRSLTTGEIKYLLLISTDYLTALDNITVSEGRLNTERLLSLYEADPDWDGYSTTIENLFGTNPNDISNYPDLVSGDADGDRLLNHLELAYGTIPVTVSAGINYSGKLYPIYLNTDGTLVTGARSSDSDNDGISDLDEIQVIDGYYTDPANPDTDGDGILDGNDASPSYAKVGLNNLSLGTTVTASDYLFIGVPKSAVDGNEATYWSTNMNAMPPHWLSINLGKKSKIYAIKNSFDPALRIPRSYKLQFSNNGDFTNNVLYEYAVTNNTMSSRTDVLPNPIDASYVRILVTEPDFDGIGNNFFRLREITTMGTRPSNIAANKQVTQSDYFYVWGGVRALDQDANTFWATNPSVSSTHWLSVNLQGNALINNIEVNFDSVVTVPKKFKLLFSNSGNFTATGPDEPYSMDVDNSGMAVDKAVLLNVPISARYIRLVIVDINSNEYVRVKEFKVNGTLH